MSRFKVALIASNFEVTPDVFQAFEEAGVDFVYHECYTREDLDAYAADADVLWLMSDRGGLVTEENLDLFPRVGAAIKCGSGTDNIDAAACTRRGIIVAHTPEDVTEPTSDHFVAMLFAAVRQIPRQDRLMRRGVWDAAAASPLAHLTGAELGLIGFGRIGRAIVRKLAGFRMRVRIADPYVGFEEIEAAGAEKVSLEELLAASQLVLVACPKTAETEGLLGEAELRAMRRDAVLVNCARAGIVDEAALATALREGWIRGAAFDVWGEHPPSPDSELGGFENLILTPHMAGLDDRYPEGVFDSTIAVILDMAKMRRPRWIVNKGVVPRWDMTPPDEDQGQEA